MVVAMPSAPAMAMNANSANANIWTEAAGCIDLSEWRLSDACQDFSPDDEYIQQPNGYENLPGER